MSESNPIEPTPTSPVSDAVNTASEQSPSNSVAIASTTDSSKLARTARADDAPQSWLWLTKLDQAFVTVFVAVFLALSGYHWFVTLGHWGLQPIEIDRLLERQYDFRIDINSASWVEWTQIEGIGEVTANKIVADRDSNGPFRTIDDLLRVKGIGPKTLAKMRPFLREPSDRPLPNKNVP